LTAQGAALKAERRTSREMERLNDELRLKARELALLLELSNLLAAPMNLQDRLQSTLAEIVDNLYFSDAGMILLTRRESDMLHVRVSVGLTRPAANTDGAASRYSAARDLGEQCVQREMVVCRHLDGEVIEFLLESALQMQECRQYQSPVVMISLPLVAQQRVIGSIVLAGPEVDEHRLTVDEFTLMVGIAQQLGLSIENARLYQQAQKREKLLSELLQQVVGAQEAERRRIARELHDATGQCNRPIADGNLAGAARH
jgi:GAF domain-containing protein